MINIKYFAMIPPSTAVPLIGASGLYTWFSDASGNWVAGGSVTPPPTGGEFALVGATTGTPPSTAKEIDTIPTSEAKDPFPPPPPALAGMSYATYSTQFSTMVVRDFEDPMTTPEARRA
jgi:hypothetical protein